LAAIKSVDKASLDNKHPDLQTLYMMHLVEACVCLSVCISAW